MIANATRPILALITAALVGGLVVDEGVATSATVHRIVIDGPISPATDDFITSAIELADDGGALALVIQLDTPGGLLQSTKTIVQAILSAPLPVIVYVAPGGASATSAGVFITLSGHIAAMAPGTTIGAAHPVSGGGADIEGDMGKKVENFAVSFIGSIAEQRGRNVEWAEAAVRESVSITESEAVEEQVVDVVADGIDELIEMIDGRTVNVAGEDLVLDFSSARTPAGRVIVVDHEMTLRQRVLNIITDPNIAYLLMMAGMLGLYMEFSNPGTIFPGVAGAICLLLALQASQVLPINQTAIMLIILGMAFLVAELFLPSFGVLGFGGLLALTLGSLFMYTPESQLIVDRSLIVASIFMFGAALVLVLGFIMRDRRRRAQTGAEGLVGEIGRAVGTIDGTGRVRVHGEYWNAVSTEPIDGNARVRVESVDGLTITVRREEE
jgi:membrane-bound serine protease (ClpP class)